VSKKRLHFLTFKDFEVIASTLISNWTGSSVSSGRKSRTASTSTLETNTSPSTSPSSSPQSPLDSSSTSAPQPYCALNPKFVDRLRGLKLLMNKDMFEKFKGLVLTELRASYSNPTKVISDFNNNNNCSSSNSNNNFSLPQYPPNLHPDVDKIVSKVKDKFVAFLKLLLHIGANLSQPREFKDFLVDLVEKIAVTFNGTVVRPRDLCLLFASMLPTFQRMAMEDVIPSKRVKIVNAWERYIRGVSVCFLTLEKDSL